MKYLEKLINWSELSRYITGGDRTSLRPKKKIPEKYYPALDKLIKEDLPEWWEKRKAESR